MATRLYLCAAEATPVTPGFAAWQETDGALRRRMRTFTDAGDALANGSAQASTAGNTQLHRQFVSDRLAAGITFTSGVSTLTCQIQGLESAANDNIINRVRCVKVVSEDGNTIRATLIALGNATSVVEWNTAMRNLTFLNATTVGATYTTVAGDRLVLEVGHDDSAGSTVSGTLRFGADSGGSGDLGVNETDTTTTLRPWFESSVNLTFPQDVAGATLSTSTLFAGAAALNVSGATLATSALFAGSVALQVSGATLATSALFAGAVSGAAQDVAGATLSTSTLFAGANISPWLKVATASAQSANQTDATTPAIDTTGADLLVAAVFDEDGETTLTDSNSNTWIGLTERQDPILLKQVRIYYCFTPTVGAGHTFTVTHTGGNTSYPSVAVQAWKGGGAFDSESGATGSAGTLQPGSLTAAAATELFVFAGNPSGGDGTQVVDSAFMNTAALKESGDHDAGVFAFKVRPATGSENPTWTPTSGVARAAAMAVFTAATAAGNIGGATLATSTLFAGTTSIDVSGAFLGPTSSLFAGATSLAVQGATIGPTGALFAGAATIALQGGTIAAGSQLFAGTAGLQVAGAFLGPTGTLFAGATTLTVSGATLATSALFAGTVTTAGTVAGAFIGPTGILFAGTAAVQATGAFLGPTSTLFAGSVALQVAGATLASGSTLFAGTVSGDLDLAGAFLGPTGILFAGGIVGAALAEPVVKFHAFGTARVFRSAPPLERIHRAIATPRTFRAAH